MDMRPDLGKHKRWSTETGPKPKMIPGAGTFLKGEPATRRASGGEPATATTETQHQKSIKCELDPILPPACWGVAVE